MYHATNLDGNGLLHDPGLGRSGGELFQAQVAVGPVVEADGGQVGVAGIGDGVVVFLCVALSLHKEALGTGVGTER